MIISKWVIWTKFICNEPPRDFIAQLIINKPCFIPVRNKFSNKKDFPWYSWHRTSFVRDFQKVKLKDMVHSKRNSVGPRLKLIDSLFHVVLFDVTIKLAHYLPSDEIRQVIHSNFVHYLLIAKTLLWTLFFPTVEKNAVHSTRNEDEWSFYIP